MTLYTAPRKHTLKVKEVLVSIGTKVLKDDGVLVVEDEAGLIRTVFSPKSAEIVSLPVVGQVIFEDDVLYEAIIKNDLGLRHVASLIGPSTEGPGEASAGEQRHVLSPDTVSAVVQKGSSSKSVKNGRGSQAKKKKAFEGVGVLSLVSLLVTIVFGGLGLYFQYRTVADKVPVPAPVSVRTVPSPSLSAGLPDMDYEPFPDEPRGFRDAFWHLKTSTDLEVYSLYYSGPAPDLYTVDGEVPTDPSSVIIHAESGDPVIALRPSEFLLGRTHVLKVRDDCEFDKIDDSGEVIKKYNLSLVDIFSGKEQVYGLDCDMNIDKVHVEFASDRRIIESGLFRFTETIAFVDRGSERVVKVFGDIFEQQPLVGPDGNVCKADPIEFGLARRSITLDTQGRIKIDNLPDETGYAYAILPESMEFPGGCREAQTEEERARIEAQYQGPPRRLALPSTMRE